MAHNITNPYAPGTADSKLFRIPSILTLKNGRVLAGADIRYGNGTDDPANIETVIRYSDDNCKTWSDIVWVNHFNDMEDCDHNNAIPTSASFCDSAMCEDKNGVVYHVCDACPAYMGLWSAGTYGKDNGYIDGKLALCDKTSHEKAESTTLDKKHYPYYVDSFNENGFAPVLKFSDNESYKNYFVDRGYYIYEKKDEEYIPVLIKQMNKDGSLNDNEVIANIFYAYAPIKIYPTYYLWVKKSYDNGETWSDGKILNPEINSRGFTGFSPGVGISIGLTRLFFVLEDQGYLNANLNTAPADALIIPMTDDLAPSIALATKLRDAEIRTQIHAEQKKFKQKMSYADKIGVPFAIFLGEEEIKEGVAAVKNMRTGEQVKLPYDEVVAHIDADLIELRKGTPILDKGAIE